MPVTTIILATIHILKCTCCLKRNYIKKYNDAGDDGLGYELSRTCLDLKIKQRVLKHAGISHFQAILSINKGNNAVLVHLC